MNLADNLRATARRHPDRVAVKMDDVELSYAELTTLAARTAGWLQELGVQRGDRVAVAMPNIPLMPVLYYGILWAGAVVVPMNPLYKDREYEHVLRDSGAAVFFAWNEVAEQAGKGAADAGTRFIEVDPATFAVDLTARTASDMAESHPQHTAVILYTSGTTGAPKGAELTHVNLVANALICAGAGIMGLSSGDVVFGGLPLFHVFGQTAMLNASVTPSRSMISSVTG